MCKLLDDNNRGTTLFGDHFHDREEKDIELMPDDLPSNYHGDFATDFPEYRDEVYRPTHSYHNNYEMYDLPYKRKRDTGKFLKKDQGKYSKINLHLLWSKQWIFLGYCDIFL